ncbi:MAG: DUF1499 domain-containing protein [Salaquimonas sp.]|nr:DUF1499 domain-containing protein [Salaquimonas sp.]
MTGFYERRTSRAAYWCQRIALVCVPYFLISILLHRFAKVTTPETYWLIAFGLLMLLASLALGARAVFDLWTRGDRGGGATIRGVLLSLIMLAPFVWYAWLAVKYPVINDVSTNPDSPPAFVELAAIRQAGLAKGMSPLADYDDAYADLLISAYPKVGSRRYNTGAARIYTAARALIAKRHWRIVAIRGLSDSGGEKPAAEDDANAAAKNGGDDETPLDPDAPLDIEIEAVASSRVFGFKSDIVIAIHSEAESTLVDMRSASRYGQHDFGANAAQIESFLADLDKALIGIAGEG